jgi:N-hydroxyarylamine O-acetyltransferase
MGRRIRLSEDAFYEKIIKHHRGGFCYELNGSFASLLRRLGFKVRMLSARVASKTGGFSPEFDHMTLLVTMKDRWLADVGFGDSFTEPKLLDYPSPQTDSGRIYQITRKMGGRLLSRWDAEKKIWEPQYQFTLQARNLADYARRCRWHETSPNSHFRKGRMCTRLTPNGRVTLTDRKLIVTRGSKRTESSVKTRTEFNRLLQKQFGMNPG